MKPCPCDYDTCNVYYTDNGYFPTGSGYCIEDARLISESVEMLLFMISEEYKKGFNDQRVLYFIEKITQKSWATIVKLYHEVYEV